MSPYSKIPQTNKVLFLRILPAFVLIFLSDVFFDIILPGIYPEMPELARVFLDTLILLVIAVPSLWWFVFKPTLVTPRMMEAQQSLQKSEARFRNLADFAPVGIFETDAQGDYIFVNRKWCEIMGFSSEQALGKGWLSVLPPEEKLLVQDTWMWAAAGGFEFKLEYRVNNPGTPEKWVSGSATALKSEDGAICNFMGVVIDITKRRLSEVALRESEDRFRTLFDHSEDAIFLLVPESCLIIDVNSTAEKLFGYTKEEMVGYDFKLLKPQQDCDNCMLSVCKLADSEIRNIDHLVNLTKDGNEIHLSVRAKEIRLSGEEVIFCTMRDITLRMRMEEEARTMQAGMIHSNKMTSLGLLVAGIAHEINNPNNYIMVNAQMLYKIWEDLAPILKEEEQKQGDFMLGGLPYSQLEGSLPEMIEAINDGSRRIRNIIGALKSYSRTGKSAMDLLEINRVVDAAMLLLKHNVIKYTDNFVLELEAELPRIRGSSQQLEQVIINLVMNALQSLTDRTEGLTLKTSFSAEKSAVIVTVADEGRGIPDELKKKNHGAVLYHTD